MKRFLLLFCLPVILLIGSCTYSVSPAAIAGPPPPSGGCNANWPSGFPHPTESAVETWTKPDMACYQGTTSDGSQAVATWMAASPTQQTTWFNDILADVESHGIDSTTANRECRYYFSHDAMMLFGLPGLSLLGRKRKKGVKV